MAEIKEYNKCEKCLHNEVCQFKTDREESVIQVAGKIDNIGYMQDFFEFTFKCKKFISREARLKI